MSSVTANSRMIYAFSRDGALPFSSFWHRVNKRTRTPTNAIWLAAVGALILGLPYLWNPRRVLRRHLDRDDRPVHRLRDPDLPAAAPGRELPARAVAPGPVELRGRLDRRHLGGDHHDPVHAAAGRPDHHARRSTTPWSRCVVVIGFAGIYWLVSARKWFKGPKVQGTPEELAAIETRARRPSQLTKGAPAQVLHDRRAQRPARHAHARAAARRGRARARSTRSCSPSPTCRAPAGQAPVRRVLPRRGDAATTRRGATTCSRWTSR